jgi:hypothetical protein
MNEMQQDMLVDFVIEDRLSVGVNPLRTPAHRDRH